MAKKKPDRKETGVNKTKLVREFLTAQPDAMPRAVSEALKERNVEVSPQIVSQIKYQMRLMGGSGLAKAAGAKGRATGALSAEELVKVKKLADELGGQQKVAQALEILRKLG